MFLISLVGHSNVPRDPLYVRDCEIRTFRSPGARADRFDDNPVLREVLGWQHDLAILFLGSNDVSPDVEAYEITENIKAIVNKLKQCARKVTIVLLEPRVITNAPPGRPDQGTYNRVVRSVNRKLQRDLREHDFINFSAPYFRQHLKPDGVHWNSEGKAKVKRDLLRYINRTDIQEFFREFARARTAI